MSINKIINVGFIDYSGSGKAHQSNTVYSSFGVSPCLCSYENRYGGIQTNILVKEKNGKIYNYSDS